MTVTLGYGALIWLSLALLIVGFVWGARAWHVEFPRPARTEIEVDALLSTDVLAQEIEALRHPQVLTAPLSATEDTLIVEALRAGVLSCAFYHKGPDGVRAYAHHESFKDAGVSIEGTDVRQVYRRYLRVLPAAKKIRKQKRAVAALAAGDV